MKNPVERWKLSPMDLESRLKREDSSRASDEMFALADIKQAPWYVVSADDKRRARLNCIRHRLEQFPYHDQTPEPVDSPARPKKKTYVRPPESDETMVKDWYA